MHLHPCGKKRMLPKAHRHFIGKRGYASFYVGGADEIAFKCKRIAHTFYLAAFARKAYGAIVFAARIAPNFCALLAQRLAQRAFVLGGQLADVFNA